QTGKSALRGGCAGQPWAGGRSPVGEESGMKRKVPTPIAPAVRRVSSHWAFWLVVGLLVAAVFGVLQFRRANAPPPPVVTPPGLDRKSTRLNSSHEWISYAVLCLKKKKKRTSDKHALQ